MGALLILIGVVGLVLAIVSLVRPTGWLGLTTRASSGWLLAASLVVVVIGGVLVPEGEATPSQVTLDTTAVGSETTSSVADTTIAPDPSTTGEGSQPSPGPEFGPPIAGPSGDPAAPLAAAAVPVTVVSITDGDTIDVRFEDGSVDTVRLIGINTPESGECWGDEAGRVLGVLTPTGSTIGLTVDVSDRDQYDRLLRYVWLGGLSVNEEMVRRGAAISRRYPPDTSLAVRFESAQEAARSQNLGLWKPDACGPAADAELEVVGVVYDAAGDDSKNLNGEYVTIVNAGEGVVDMTSWGLKDESASNRYQFPPGFVVAAGETVTVFSGCGEDTGTSLYWCSSGSAIWNNDGDTAFLTDPSGNNHDSRTFAPSTTATVAGPGEGDDCDSDYPGVCIPPYPPDLDCGEIAYRQFEVVGSDGHGFDSDNDGLGCES